MGAPRHGTRQAAHCRQQGHAQRPGSKATHNEGVQRVDEREGDAALRVFAAAADGAEVVLGEGTLHVLPIAKPEHAQRLLPAGTDGRGGRGGDRPMGGKATDWEAGRDAVAGDRPEAAAALEVACTSAAAARWRQRSFLQQRGMRYYPEAVRSPAGSTHRSCVRLTAEGIAAAAATPRQCPSTCRVPPRPPSCTMHPSSAMTSASCVQRAAAGGWWGVNVRASSRPAAGGGGGGVPQHTRRLRQARQAVIVASICSRSLRGAPCWPR